MSISLNCAMFTHQPHSHHRCFVEARPNALFSCAGAVVQRLCHSPKRKPSEASRQRQLEHVLEG